MSCYFKNKWTNQ